MTPSGPQRRLRRYADDFRQWEILGRGWQTREMETDLEPRFPNMDRHDKAPRPVDDGLVPRVWERVLSRRDQVETNVARQNKIETTSETPNRSRKVANTRAHRIELPKELKLPAEQSKQMLSNLASSAPWVSFELVATDREIEFQLACPEDHSQYLVSNVKSHLPDLDCHPSEDLIARNFPRGRESETVIVDYGLEKEWFLPLPQRKGAQPDTLATMIAVADTIRGGEAVCLQVRFCRAKGGWQQAVQNALSHQAGKDLFEHLQNQLGAVKEKLSGTLLAARVSLAVTSASKTRSFELARAAQSFFRQFTSPLGNSLIPLKNENRSSLYRFKSFLNRTTYRSGFFASSRELESIIHPPADSIRSPKLKRVQRASRPAPDFAFHGDLQLGENRDGQIARKIFLSSEKRIKHTHVIGASGSGKSTLLTTMMRQDLELGNGFACFDPHGDLIDAVIEHLPASRMKDVIIFDPSDEEFPLGFNILSAHSELEKTLLSSDLVGIFRRFATSWGDQMNSVLANAVLAFLESDRGGNLIELKRFLVDKRFREEFLKTVNDDEVRYYWQREFPELRGKPYAPLITRLDTFLRSKLIRHIVSQKDNKLDFRAIMDEQKILLVKLSLGAIGEENAYLLGCLLVAKIYMATVSRQEIAEADRKPYYLYLDESHHFITPSMNQILTGVRKYKLGLVLAHQQLAQFQKSNADILASVLSNCYARICFRVDDSDAERLSKGFSFFTSDHLRNLGVGEAIARFEQSQHSFNLKTFPLEKVPTEIATARQKAVIEQSRKLYAKPRSVVEKELQRADPEPQRCEKPTGTKVPTQAFEDPTETISGRGGRHHQELQNVIRRMAENLGFQAEIEQPILGGDERVDVSLERDGLRIACEVSVTTTDYEIHNVEKCLAEGYDYVAIVAANDRKIPLIERKISEQIPQSRRDKVKVCGLMDLLAFLNTLGGVDEIPPKVRKSASQRLNFKDACELLEKSQATLYRWVKEGKVPFYRVGREYQFDRDELLLIGKHDLSGKRKVAITVEPLNISKEKSKSKKEQDARYRKLLKLD